MATDVDTVSALEELEQHIQNVINDPTQAKPAFPANCRCGLRVLEPHQLGMCVVHSAACLAAFLAANPDAARRDFQTLLDCAAEFRERCTQELDACLEVEDPNFGVQKQPPCRLPPARQNTIDVWAATNSLAWPHCMALLRDPDQTQVAKPTVVANPVDDTDDLYEPL